MFRDQKLELRVGMFVGLSVVILFWLIFSVKDFSAMGNGYSIDVVFDFVNGIKDASPVRLAGVDVGEVRSIEIFRDGKEDMKRVKVNIWIKEGVEIETDATARINTLGLLGERYMEITPGRGNELVPTGGVLEGKDPFDVGKHMEKMGQVLASLARIAGYIESGQGTFGKLIMDDSLYDELKELIQKMNSGKGSLGKLLNEDELYDDLTVIMGRLRDGEGTLGKFLTDDSLYVNADALVLEIKDNPWKLLHKPRTRDK